MTELDELKHDIAEYVKVSSEMASEIVSQQAKIERLKGQRDRLLDAIKIITPQISAKAKRARASQQEILLLQLIAEIEGHSKYARDE